MTALPLPNARVQFIDANGDPLVGGKVYSYIPETTDPKPTWQDGAQTILNTNPIILDDLGSAAIWAVGAVRQIVEDAEGNQIWDWVTSNALGEVALIDLSNATYQQPGTGGQNVKVVDWWATQPVNVLLFIPPELWPSIKSGANVTDLSGYIQAAIDYLQNDKGGILQFPVGKYRVATALTVGNGNSTPGLPGANTKSPVGLVGFCPASGVGAYAPNGSSVIESTVDGPAITFNGCLGGGLEGIYFLSATTNAAAVAIRLNEVQSCSFRRLAIQDFPSIGLDVETWGNNNATFNVFEEIFVFMGVAGAMSAAIGVKLSGPGSGGNTAFNTFNGLHITPAQATQKPLILGYADSNMFYRLDINPTSPPCQAITLDYSTGDTSFPTANKFYGADFYNNTIGKVGTPGTGATPSPNIVFGFGQINNTAFPIDGLNLSVERIKCTAALTIYVATTGNDTTGVGIYIGNPYATIQRAYDIIANNFDLNGFTATIQLANGTYAAGLLATKPVVGGMVTIAGNNASPGSVVVSTSGNCFDAEGGASFMVKDLLVSTSSGDAIRAFEGSISFQNLVFGTVTGSHVSANGSNSIVIETANCFVNGNAAFHFRAISGGQIRADGITDTLLANVTFTQYASASSLGNIRAASYIFTTGAFTVTGTRYIAAANSVIDVNGGGANIFPGTVAGSTATGGQYV